MSQALDFAGAGQDLREGLGRSWMWHALAWSDLRRRFARSALGPLWLTLNILLPTAALNLLFGTALGQDRQDYFAYVAFGLVLWQFVQAVTVEGCTTFVAAGEVIRNAPLPLSLHAVRLVWRNVMILAHNLIVVAVFLALLGKLALPHWSIVPALALGVTMAGALALLLGIANARFRDLAPLVGNAMQLLFFVTPVFWYPHLILAGYEGLALLNPVAPFIELLRAPLLGAPAPAETWAIALALTALTAVLSLIAFAALRRRLVFWV
jgi:ABC-type polysaccharide/polyol phosphate export permease